MKEDRRTVIPGKALQWSELTNYKCNTDKPLKQTERDGHTQEVTLYDSTYTEFKNDVQSQGGGAPVGGMGLDG